VASQSLRVPISCHLPLAGVSWFTHQMDQSVERILREALHAADERGVSRPRITDLGVEDRNRLALSTLEYLRSRPHAPSPYPKWQQVRGFDAGVLRWWNDHLGGPFPSPTTQRLQTLRGDIYDFLEDDLGRIVKEPGQNSPVHLAPADAVDVAPTDELTNRTIHVSDRGAGFGDAATNRLVEAAAMRVAIDTYAGWEGGFIRSSQHRLITLRLRVARRGPLLGSSSRGSCGAGR
jgi:hypothetical protein